MLKLIPAVTSLLSKSCSGAVENLHILALPVRNICLEAAEIISLVSSLLTQDVECTLFLGPLYSRQRPLS